MVDISSKVDTTRTAVGECFIRLPRETLQAIGADSGSNIDLSTLCSKKGPILTTAVISGIMAVKRTSDLIPLCHPITILSSDVTIDWHSPNELRVRCCVKANQSTGVEMEALTGTSIAALTIYDMLKASSHDIIINNLRLVSKSGGKRTFSRAA
jgi:cyclic pyranopterin phosphate synthase